MVISLIYRSEIWIHRLTISTGFCFFLVFSRIARGRRCFSDESQFRRQILILKTTQLDISGYCLRNFNFSLIFLFVVVQLICGCSFAIIGYYIVKIS
ncbi:unnamed protein product [Arabidopsis halleri]